MFRTNQIIDFNKMTAPSEFSADDALENMMDAVMGKLSKRYGSIEKAVPRYRIDMASALLCQLAKTKPEDTGITCQTLLDAVYNNATSNKHTQELWDKINPLIKEYLNAAKQSPIRYSKQDLFRVTPQTISFFKPAAQVESFELRMQNRQINRDLAREDSRLAQALTTHDAPLLLQHINRMLYEHIETAPQLEEMIASFKGPNPKFPESGTCSSVTR